MSGTSDDLVKIRYLGIKEGVNIITEFVNRCLEWFNEPEDIKKVINLINDLISTSDTENFDLSENWHIILSILDNIMLRLMN